MRKRERIVRSALGPISRAVDSQRLITRDRKGGFARRRWARNVNAGYAKPRIRRRSLSMPVRDGGEPLGNFLTTAAGRATWEQFASPWRFVTFLSSTVNGYSGRVLVRARAAALVSRDARDAARGIPEFIVVVFVEFHSSFGNSARSPAILPPQWSFLPELGWQNKRCRCRISSYRHFAGREAIIGYESCELIMERLKTLLPVFLSVHSNTSFLHTLRLFIVFMGGSDVATQGRARVFDSRRLSRAHQ